MSKVDIWGLGVILYELVTCNHPFQYSKGFFSVMEDIKEKPFKPLPPNVSPFMQQLLTKLLDKDPITRPDVNTLMKDPEIKKYLVKSI